MEASCGFTIMQLPPAVKLGLPMSKSLVYLPQSPRRYCKSGIMESDNCPVARNFCMSLSQASKNYQACTFETGKRTPCIDRSWLLKKKAVDATPYLNGRCVFLVGMMGSGKSTVGKVLAEALGYTFVDSDRFIEQAVGGGTTVRQIFQQWGETCFRKYESEALRQLASTPQLVVATGGGAVIQPMNWEYMKLGITVWLDVPLDALAKRIAAVGTDSRPLLDFDASDAYTKAFMALFTISKKRADAYSNADTTVSLQCIATKLGLDDIADITPTEIAIEIIDKIESSLHSKDKLHSRHSHDKHDTYMPPDP